MWLLLPLALLGVFIFVQYASLSGNSGAFSIIINALQTSSIFAGFHLMWPPILEEFFKFLSFALFDLQLFQPECAAPWLQQYRCMV